jgi:hypothetical protein
MSANKVGADPVTHTVVIKGLCSARRMQRNSGTVHSTVVWPSGIHTVCLVGTFTGTRLVAAWSARDALSPHLHARRQTHEKRSELHPHAQASI